MAVSKVRATQILGKAYVYGSSTKCPYQRGSTESRLWLTRIKFLKAKRDAILNAFITRGLVNES